MIANLTGEIVSKIRVRFGVVPHESSPGLLAQKTRRDSPNRLMTNPTRVGHLPNDYIPSTSSGWSVFLVFPARVDFDLNARIV
jgi:hypothetical protein